MVDDDDVLLEAWRRGNRDAGDALFQRHFTSLFRFFQNKVDEHHVQDLIQATFMACVEGRDRVRSDGSFRAYMFGTARNVLLGHYREKQRNARIDPSVTSLCDLVAGPSTLLRQRAEVRLLAAALRRLPFDLQMVLELHYWEGLTSAELGRVLDIPAPTARSRLRRARERLEDLMRDLGESPDLVDSTLSGLERWAHDLRDQVEHDDPGDEPA